ncbi:DNA repair protein RadC [Pseudorhodobacter sp.]|uniref:DNA repair protein RadC n=1 Tax=Pseudorhodobacter sp. TaxID=1934400 RepID=UPI0026488DB5|nr:DNA repair protein RadC [Pseudorhodobacter sp.]MDN5788623.1 DNA repair protein RadC [Pseudorhodobacter sp.]
MPVRPTTRTTGLFPRAAFVAADANLPFALTLSNREPAALMSGQAGPSVLGRFPTLAVAMLGAIGHADGIASDATPQLLAILDREDRLVLAGAAHAGAVAWCHPVTSAIEARAVVTEASQLRAHAGRAADWREPELARRLRHRADLLDARLVDPLWRAFTAKALQVAA